MIGRDPHPLALVEAVRIDAVHARVEVEGAAPFLPGTLEERGEQGASEPLGAAIARGHEVEILAAEEGAAYGAALLAGVGARFWNSVEEACDAVVKVEKRVPPDNRATKALRRQYQNYQHLYPALKPLFATMSEPA